MLLGRNGEPDPNAATPSWHLLLGLPILALLRVEELQALVLYSAIPQFQPPTPIHGWLWRLHDRVVRWHFALPPHPGFLSLPHYVLERLVWILQPIGGQLKIWTENNVLKTVPRSTIIASLDAVRISITCLPVYWTVYDRVVKLGFRPPFTEGFLCFASEMTGNTEAKPAFKEWDGFWVCERQFLGNLYGSERMRNLQCSSWKDVLNAIGPATWKAEAALLRQGLIHRCVADLPELVTAWRTLLAKSFPRAVSKVTPDVLRQHAVQMLGSVFALALFHSGWQLQSSFKGMIFVKDQKEIAPFDWVRDLASGHCSRQEFLARCEETATASLPLVS